MSEQRPVRMTSKKLSISKRIMDVVISVLLLPIAIVLSLIFGCLFYLMNRENPLFVQMRVGRLGQEFKLVKLRTMSSSTKDKPTHEISSSDISTLGKIMRAIKVDELPQLYNVLRGEMSLVGPRPCLPSQTELVNERDRLGVYELLPGITGYAQVRGVDMSVPSVLAEMDSHYASIRSLSLDFSLLLQTVVGRGSGDKTSK